MIRIKFKQLPNPKNIDMQQYTKYILALLLAAVCLPAFAQKITINTEGPPTPKYPPFSSLNLPDRQQVIQTAESLINEYQEAGTLLDEKRRSVTSASMDRFRALFNPVARIVKDYEENIQGDLVGVREYADGVYNRLGMDGVKLQVTGARLEEIRDDPGAGYWVVVLEVEKVLYNAVTTTNQVKELSTGGRYLKQRFFLDIKKGDLGSAKISRIERTGKDGGGLGAARYTQYMGPSLSMYLPIANPSFSAFWTNNHAGSNLDTQGRPSFSLGFEFTTNKLAAGSSPTKNFFLSAGFGFSYLQLANELRDFSASFDDVIAVDRNGNESPYLRLLNIGESLSVDEKLSVSMIEIPLGITYRLKKNIRSDIMLSARLAPTFVLSASGKLTGSADYYAVYPQALWVLPKEGAYNPDDLDRETGYAPYKAGKLSFDGTSSPPVVGFLLAARISPAVYFHLSEDDASWSLLVGLDLNFNLGSFLKHTVATEDILRFPEDYDDSILQSYTDGLFVFSPGLRIGLHHRLTSRP